MSELGVDLSSDRPGSNPVHPVHPVPRFAGSNDSFCGCDRKCLGPGVFGQDEQDGQDISELGVDLSSDRPGSNPVHPVHPVPRFAGSNDSFCGCDRKCPSPGVFGQDEQDGQDRNRGERGSNPRPSPTKSCRSCNPAEGIWLESCKSCPSCPKDRSSPANPVMLSNLSCASCRKPGLA